MKPVRRVRSRGARLAGSGQRFRGRVELPRYARRVAEATVTLRDNAAQQRYELVLDDEVVGEIVYRLRPGAVALLHTEVSADLEGKGLGARLVAGALEDIRARGLRLVPLCPFVGAYLRRHPEEADLVQASTT